MIITDNTIDNSGIGISFGQNAQVTDLVIERNHLSNNNAGVSLICGNHINVAITDCVFEASAWEDIDLGCWGNVPTLENVAITKCEFYGGSSVPWASVYIEANFTGGDIRINNNKFSPIDQYGVLKTGSYVDAKCNWWGDASGPTHAGNLRRCHFIRGLSGRSLSPGMGSNF